MNRFWAVSAVLLINSLLLSFLFLDTSQNLIAIWRGSDTYQYGFFILPITFWLLWQKQNFYQNKPIKPSYIGLLFFLLSGLIWVLGRIIEAGIIEQYGLVAMLVASLWAFLGTPLFKVLLFPFCYLLLMVPIGEDLVPLLMQFTAYFTTEAIKLTGIPVFREGLFISLPTGDWNVVQACSGIRYLLSSLILGILFAYLSYQSILKRAIFILAAVIVPIIANGLRAFLIVMIGHFSNNKLATGIDHFIYGWFFFALVIFVLFAIGSRWQDPEPVINITKNNQSTTYQFSFVLAILLIGCSFFIQKSEQLVIALSQPVIEKTIFPEYKDHWKKTNLAENFWHPITPNAALIESTAYINQKLKITGGIYRVHFRGDEESELTGSENTWVDKTKYWRVKQQQSHNLMGFNVNQVILKSPHQQIIVWSWYEIANQRTTNKYKAKLYELKQRLFNHQSQTKRLYYFLIKPKDMEITTLSGYLVPFIRKFEY